MDGGLMPIKLNGQTTGSVTLAAPAIGSDVTLTLPSSSTASVATSDTAYMLSTSYPSNRNILTNGSFSVWQRGTSSNSAGGAVYVDCWREYSDTAVGTQSRDTSITAAGTRQSYKFTANASTATNMSLFQIIETANCFHTVGRQVVFSVYLSSSTTQTIALGINYNTSEDAAWTSGSWTSLTSSSFSVSPTMTRYFITAAVPSNARTLQVSVSSSPTFTASSFVNVAAAQLELGSSPTQFEFEDYGTTLRKCQRYFIRYQNNGDWCVFNTGAAINTTEIFTSWHLPTSMRTIPSISVNSLSNFRVYPSGTNSPTSIVSGRGMIDGKTININWTTTGLTAGYAYAVVNLVGATAIVDLSAEL